MRHITIIIAMALLAFGCNDSAGNAADAGSDAGSDTDTDVDAGSDAGADTDTESDTGDECADVDPFDPAACGAAEPSPCVFFVRAAAAVGGDGLAWGTAFSAVQDGIDAAACASLASGGTCQVWVGAGIYYIHQGCDWDTVRLREGVEVYGGFAGGEASLDDRDWEENLTVLDGHASAESPSRAFHVVNGSDSSLLDGFTVTGGYNSGETSTGGTWSTSGGGMRNLGVSPTVRHCAFQDNEVANFGGAMGNVDGAPIVEECAFSNNTANYGGAMVNANASTVVSDSTFTSNTQGAVGVWEGSNVTMSGCSFSGNTALYDDRGGAVGVQDSTLALSRCAFDGNAVEGELLSGGAVKIDNSDVSISACRFTGNAADHGGALASQFGSVVTMENSVFAGNAAAYGGASYVHDNATASFANCTFIGNTASAAGGAVAAAFDLTEVTLINSVLWDNGVEPLFLYDDAVMTVSTSDVEGGYAGDGNIDAVPLFVDAAGGDFHLQAGSPCIDAADGDLAPEFDFDGFSRWDDPSVVNTGVGDPDYADMGAYERQ